MQGTVHLLVGAAIGATVPHTPTAVVLAVFSHYLLDTLPHIDPDTFADGETPYNIRQKIGLTVDASLVATLLVALFLVRNQPTVLLGAIAAQAPDLLIPLERYEAVWPLKRVHFLFHWDDTKAEKKRWYVAGILVPAIMAAAALAVIVWG